MTITSLTLIKLTDEGGVEVQVSPLAVAYVSNGSGGTIVHFIGGAQLRVRESLDDVSRSLGRRLAMLIRE